MVKKDKIDYELIVYKKIRAKYGRMSDKRVEELWDKYYPREEDVDKMRDDLVSRECRALEDKILMNYYKKLSK